MKTGRHSPDFYVCATAGKATGSFLLLICIPKKMIWRNWSKFIRACRRLKRKKLLKLAKRFCNRVVFVGLVSRRVDGS